MKRFYLLTAISMFLFSFGTQSSFAEKIKLTSSGQNRMQLTDKGFDSFEFQSTLSELEFSYENTGDQVFTRLSSEGYTSTMIPGSPSLPVLKKLIEIPQDAQALVEIIDATFKDYTLEELGINHPVFPYQMSLPKVKNASAPFEYNEDAYATDAFSPERLITIEEAGTMRAVRLGRININAVQYNPVQAKLRVYSDIKVRVVFENANYQKTIRMKKNTYSPYFTKAYAQLINYEPMQMRDEITQVPVKYVIVSDPMFETALQPLVDWKTEKGYTVIEAYTDNPAVGTTTTSIKAYLQGLYNAGTPDDPAPTFVLFCGDVAQIPVFNGSGHVTDLYYCEYDGDYIPEMYYGRFSATNVSEITPQVAKTVEYEKYEFPDPSFLGECVMVSGVDGGHAPTYGNGQINYGTTYYFNNAHGLLSHTYLYPASGSASAAIIQHVSDGVAYANYTAHGNWDGWSDPSFKNSDVPGLQNDHKYPLMVGNCCLTNKFEQGSCFGETLLRAEGKGAIGYIGGTNSTYWDEDYYWGVGVGAISANPTYEGTSLGSYDKVFHDHGEAYDDWFTTQGQQNYAGCLAVTESGSSRTQYYWEIYALMGDPSVSIYFGVPPAMTVTYDVMPIASEDFTVNAPPYSLVAISYEGELRGTAQTNASGVALVHFDNPIMGGNDADIVVTGQNYQPFFGTITMAGTDGPYVIKDSFTLDNASGASNPVPGDDVDLSLTMKNVGSENSINTVVDITTSDSYITITDDTENYGIIIAGQSKAIANGYAFSVADSIPDGHMVSVSVSATDGTDVWTSSINFELFAPSLLAGAVSVDDAAGNNNGRLDPGETANIIVALTNNGQAAADNVIANLNTNSTDITINTSSVNLGTLTPSETDNAIFEITVAANAAIGSLADFIFDAASGIHYTADKNFSLNIGLIVEDFETGDFSRYNWAMGGNAPWQIVTSPVYEGVYGAASGDISDNQDSELSITLDVIANDSISFYSKVSSENNYDDLVFYIDGTAVDSWSGVVDWENHKYPVSAGTHIFKWAYEKDYSMSSGDDAAYLDFIILPAFGTPSANAGSDAEVCEATGHTLSGIASNYNSILWETSGNGTFDDAASLTATYTPGTADAAAGFATLTLNAIGGAATASDDMVLTVNPLPASPGQPSGDEVVCDQTQDNDYTCPQLADPGITSYVWEITPASAGTISSTDTAATVNWTDTFSGLAYIKVKAENACGYGDYSDELEVSVNETPTQAGTPTGSQAVCQGTAGTEYTTTGANNATDYTWALNPTDAGTITPNGTTATIEWSQTFDGTADLTVTGTNACGDGPASTALSISVDILPEPAITGSDAACQNDTLVYSTPSNAGCSYSWTIAGGTIVDGSGTNEVSVVWDSWGGCELMVTETNDNSGCEGTTDPFVVAVEESPAPEITGTEVVCEQEEGAIYATTDNTGNTYNWTVSGGTIESGQGTHEITVNWGAYGTGTVALTETNANACHGYAETFDVEIMEIPEAEAGDDVSIPNGTSTQLYGSATGGSGSYSFHWEPAGKLVDPNVAEPQTTELDATTIFTLEVSDNTGGCAGTDQVTVTVTGGALAVTVTADDAAVCPGSTTTLHAIPGGGSGEYTYAWTSDPAGFTSEEQNPEVSPEVNTTYYVEVDDGYNSISGEVSVSVHALPEQFEITGEDSFCEGSAGAVLGLASSESDVTYKLFLDGTNTGTTANGTGSAITFAPQAVEGTYTVMAQDQITACVIDMGDSHYLTAEYPPLRPEKPFGPEVVNFYETLSTTYTITEVPGAESYTWLLEPSDFGELIPDGNELTINWTGEKTGMVSLTVAAVNQCGEGEYSDAFDFLVDYIDGISESDEIKLDIYPNPSSGLFTLKFENFTSNNLNIKIINSVGECVYSDSKSLNSSELINIDIARFAEGVYYLVLQSDKKVYSERLLLRK